MSNTAVETTTEPGQGTGLKGFMNKGGFWRFFLFLVLYLVVYQLAGLLISKLMPESAEADLLSSVGAIFEKVTFALLVGGAVLFAFANYLGWTKDLFGRQPIYRSRWMWLGPIVALTPITLRVLGIDWGGPAISVVAFMMLTGLMIGIVEELMFRGFAVRMFRAAGHGELAVAALSTLAFALSHSVNALTGQPLNAVAITVFYTFGFGVLMYLTMRVTGFLIWAMLIHGLTDPTTMLASGALDKVATGTSMDGLVAVAGYLTIPLALVGIVLLLFVRGRAGQPKRGAHHASA